MSESQPPPNLSIPTPPRRGTAWPAALQNIAALGATVALTLHGEITGNVAAAMILAVVGVVSLPALASRVGGKNIAPLGVLSLAAKPAILTGGLVARLFL